MFLNFFLAKANSKHKQELVKLTLLDKTENPFFEEKMQTGTPLSPNATPGEDSDEEKKKESPLLQVPKRVPG